jgi:3-hydroxybutyryl-CoA dehydrogenase
MRAFGDHPMMKNFATDRLVVGIAGTGAMGRGIAQVIAQAGCEVLLYDVQEGAAQKARDYVIGMLAKLAEKGRLTPAQQTDMAASMRVVDDAAAFAPCDLVVEVIVENLAVKREFFAKLEAVTREDCVLATNTSSLSVTAIAAGCKRPERVAGYHFFNPVPLMRVVEVIAGARTEPAICAALSALAKRYGHTAVTAADTPGFIVNHAGRGYGTEALKILQEGVAEFHVVDRIMTDAAGFRLGPCELLDLTGMDVSHPVMESIYRQYYEEPRYRPSVIGQQRKDAGLLGRKTGQGFYRHIDGKQEVFADPALPAARPASVWISRANPAGHAAAADCLAGSGVTIESGPAPSAGALIIVTPLGTDATGAALDEGLDPARTVALDTLLPLAKRRTLMTTPVTLPAFRDAAHGAFGAAGVPVSVIRDSAGFVAQRILATIVNVGCDIVQQRVCSPVDLDLAVTLGLSYPKGPLAFGDALGPANVLTILRNIHQLTGDPRYRPSPWLTRRARLGISLLTPDN